MLSNSKRRWQPHVASSQVRSCGVWLCSLKVQAADIYGCGPYMHAVYLVCALHAPLRLAYMQQEWPLNPAAAEATDVLLSRRCPAATPQQQVCDDTTRGMHTSIHPFAAHQWKCVCSHSAAVLASSMLCKSHAVLCNANRCLHSWQCCIHWCPPCVHPGWRLWWPVHSHQAGVAHLASRQQAAGDNLLQVKQLL